MGVFKGAGLVTVIPSALSTLYARTDADFSEDFFRYEDVEQTIPVDLAGHTFRFVVKAAPTYAVALLEATVANTRLTIVDAAAGHIRVTFDKTTLATALRATDRDRSTVFALQVVAPNGSDEIWCAGKLLITRGL